MDLLESNLKAVYFNDLLNIRSFKVSNSRYCKDSDLYRLYFDQLRIEFDFENLNPDPNLRLKSGTLSF